VVRNPEKGVMKQIAEQVGEWVTKSFREPAAPHDAQTSLSPQITAGQPSIFAVHLRRSLEKPFRAPTTGFRVF